MKDAAQQTLDRAKKRESNKKFDEIGTFVLWAAFIGGVLFAIVLVIEIMQGVWNYSFGTAVFWIVVPLVLIFIYGHTRADRD